jgi:hypothetical protein
MVPSRPVLTVELLTVEKATVPGQLPDEKPTVHAFLDGDCLHQNHVNLFNTFFRQITPLNIRYTSTYVTIFTTLSPPISSFHTPGTSGLQPLTTSIRGFHVEEVVLDSSLNVQSQV